MEIEGKLIITFVIIYYIFAVSMSASALVSESRDTDLFGKCMIVVISAIASPILVPIMLGVVLGRKMYKWLYNVE